MTWELKIIIMHYTGNTSNEDSCSYHVTMLDYNWVFNMTIRALKFSSDKTGYNFSFDKYSREKRESERKWGYFLYIFIQFHSLVLSAGNYIWIS